MTSVAPAMLRALLISVVSLAAACTPRFPTTNWPIEDQMVEHEIGNSGGEFQQYTAGAYFHGGIDILEDPLGPWVINVVEGNVTSVVDNAGLYNGVVVTTAGGDQYVYWHLENIQTAVEDAFNNGTVLPAGTQMAQLVTWTACDFHHLHYELSDSDGIRDPILTLVPRNDTTSPIVINVSFVENTTNNVMPNNSIGLPIVNGEVDIIAHAYDTQFGSARTGVLEVRWSVEDLNGTVVVPETVMGFRDIPADIRTLDAYRNTAPFDSDSNYCGTEQYYYVPTNVDASGAIIADASGLWDTTAHPNGDYRVYVTGVDQAGNDGFTLIRQIEIDN